MGFFINGFFLHAKFEREVGFFFRLMMMAVQQRQRAALGIKSNLGKVITCTPEVGEYTCGAGRVNYCVIHFITCAPEEGKCR